jgi:hypothetical protein
MRFSQQENDFYNMRSKNTSPDTPAIDEEQIRNENLVNGILIVNGARTCNFENGENFNAWNDIKKE